MTENKILYRPRGPARFEHQRRALRRIIETRGKCALLLEPGTGKTAVAVDYASLLALKADRPVRVLVLAPVVALDSWVGQTSVFASHGVAVWAEALGGTVLQRGEALLARRKESSDPSQGLRRAVSWAGVTRDGKPVSSSLRDRKQHWGDFYDGPWASKPGVVLEVLSLDSLSHKRQVSASRTSTDKVIDAIKGFQPDLVVVDESHRLKSPSSNVSRAAARIGKLCPRRLILTGTVMPHALTLNSPILTPKGWKPMGEMRTGDQVIGSNGHPTEVVGVWPQGEKEIFTVTFSDGTSVDCTEDHLWTVTSRGRRNRRLRPLTLSTRDLTKGRTRSRETNREVGLFDKGGSARWAIPSVKPVSLPSQSVPVDPYLLGLLLGDGHLGRSVDFTTADEEIVKYVKAVLPDVLQLTVTVGQNGSRASRYRITSGRKGGSLPGSKRGPGPNPVAVALDDLGLRNLRGPEKFIPETYLWNDLETRLAVLRGLMDADGTASVGSTSKFVTTSSRLAEGVKHLVRSLGGYVTERIDQKKPTVMPQGHISPARPQHVLLFGTPFNPFRVTRKANQWKPRTEQKLRTIVSIEPKDRAQAQCITVKAEDGLFVTDNFVVTHNSPMDVWAQWRFLEPEAFYLPDTRQKTGRKPMSFGVFQDRYGVFGGWQGRQVIGYKNLGEMQKVMETNSIVVKKADALDLPPVMDVTVPVRLSTAERKAYDDMKGQLATVMSDGTFASVPNRLAQMMRLRQITSGYLPDDNGVTRTIGSSKVDAATSTVTDTLAGERRVVVFAHFRQEVAALADRLSHDEPKTVVMTITGDTPPKEREALRKRFGSDEKQRIILVAQMRTLSLAVNELVSASHAVFTSLSERRDDVVQARDRLDRLGQAGQSVTFWNVEVPGSVDEVIRKAHLERESIETALLAYIRGEQDGSGATPVA